MGAEAKKEPEKIEDTESERVDSQKKDESESIFNETDKRILYFAALALLILAYLLFIYNPGGIPLGAPIGKLVSEDSVKRRHARSLYWERLKQEQLIYLRDIVYVPKGVRATFILNNQQKIEIEPDTMVQFDEVTLDNVSVTLFGGRIKGLNILLNEDRFKLKPFEGGKLLSYLPEVPPYELRFSELNQRVQRQIRKRLRLKKVVDKQKKTLPMDKIDYFVVDLVAPEKHEQFPLSRRSWVNAVWTPVPVPGIRFEMIVSKQRDFQQALVYDTVRNNVEVKLRDESAYYWQIRAIQGKKSKVSAIGRFVVSRQGGSLLLNRIPAARNQGNVKEVARDRKFRKIVRTTVARGERCSLQGLDKGKYWCRVLTPNRKKTINRYRMVVR